jgi:hypothetical protein
MKRLQEISTFLKEAVEELYSEIEVDNPNRKHESSVDDQIDAFLIKFESDSVLSEEEKIFESFKKLSLSMLMEQPDDEDSEDTDAADEDEDESDTPDPALSDRQKTDQPLDTPKMPLDVESFTNRVARLALNAETLLNVRNVIINRALNYLENNYDPEHANEMKNILDMQFDLEIDPSNEPKEVPYAVGAYAGGTSSGGA